MNGNDRLVNIMSQLLPLFSQIGKKLKMWHNNIEHVVLELLLKTVILSLQVWPNLIDRHWPLPCLSDFIPRSGNWERQVGLTLRSLTT